MDLFVDLQIACDQEDNLPTIEQIQHWVETTLVVGSVGTREEAEVTVRIVEEIESQQLNGQFRHKHQPTNVLSFPFENPPGITLPLLGDLVICKQVVEKQAIEQKISLQSHWAHMVIHGILHLLGYDHVQDDEATEMENLEAKLMIDLGFADPYLSEKE